MTSRPVLRFTEPARRWTDAVPLGNGSLGAMCFAGTASDRFQLNDDRAWSGTPLSAAGSRRPEVDGPAVIAQVRTCLARGDVATAEKLMQTLQFGHSQSFQPVADLWIDDLDDTSAAGYERTLDLGDAVAAHRWADGAITQEAFVSHPARVLVIRRRCAAGPLNVAVRLAAAHPGARWEVAGPALRLVQRLPSEVFPMHEDVAQPVFYDDTPGASGTVLTAVRVETDGVVSAGEGVLRVTGATTLLLLVACTTDIDPDKGVHGRESLLEATVAARLDAAARRPFDVLRAEHVEDHRALFDRTHLELPAPAEALGLATDERVRRNAVHGDDPGLAGLLFAYGRYLMIAGSRPGTSPLNLQGIWNDKVRPAWSSNYTTNINLEMNYWLAGPGNLAECAEPLHEWLHRLSARGAVVARDLYGADGWVAHHNSDLWGFALPAGEGHGDPCWSAWQLGGAWLAQHLWERWAFGGDLGRLERDWPVIRGAAQFCLGWLVEDEDGALGTCPSTSPENTFRLPDGTAASVSRSTTSDVVLLRELFGRCLQVLSLLGIEDDDFAARLRDALHRLPHLRVAADGRIAEWSLDVPDAEPTHRHQSHLIGFHPGALVDVDRDPALAEAARTTLAARGPRSTGWSLAWRLCLHARLRDPAAARAAIAAFLAPMADDASDEPSMTAPSGIYRNLFCAHPPFQLDGNLGFAAGVVELLLQSQHGEIHLLPCLPPGWDHGTATGLRARPGVTVDLTWTDRAVQAVRLTTDRPQEVVVRCGERRTTVALNPGATVLLDGGLVPAQS